jgi:hypothetical protein
LADIYPPPLRRFICGLCGEETTATQTDLQALDEFSRMIFPTAVDLNDCELVCDKCYFGQRGKSLK